MTRLSNTELQEKLQLIIEEIVMQGATYADSKDGLRDKNYVRAEKKAFRELLALFQAREQKAYKKGYIDGLLDQNKTNDGGKNGGL